MSSSTAAASSHAHLRRLYREFLLHLKHSPSPNNSSRNATNGAKLQDLRVAFKKPLQQESESIQERLKTAESRLAVLRMSNSTKSNHEIRASMTRRQQGQQQQHITDSSNDKNANNSSDSKINDGSTSSSGVTRWVYKDGQRFDAIDGTLRDNKGRVHSNWDGNNLDPESVKRHHQSLRRAGFVNNAHAKGVF